LDRESLKAVGKKKKEPNIPGLKRRGFTAKRGKEKELTFVQAACIGAAYTAQSPFRASG